MNAPKIPGPDKPPLEYSLVISAYYENLNSMREFVGQIAQASGFSYKEVDAIEMAADEACTNIIEHAYEGERDMPIECFCQVTEQAMIMTLHDHGKPFNPLDVPQPDLFASLEDRDIGGLGLYLMRNLMDEVTFSFTAGSERSDNILTMIKHKKTGV